MLVYHIYEAEGFIFFFFEILVVSMETEPPVGWLLVTINATGVVDHFYMTKCSNFSHCFGYYGDDSSLSQHIRHIVYGCDHKGAPHISTRHFNDLEASRFFYFFFCEAANLILCCYISIRAISSAASLNIKCNKEETKKKYTSGKKNTLGSSIPTCYFPSHHKQ